MQLKCISVQVLLGTSASRIFARTVPFCRRFGEPVDDQSMPAASLAAQRRYNEVSISEINVEMCTGSIWTRSTFSKRDDAISGFALSSSQKKSVLRADDHFEITEPIYWKRKKYHLFIYMLFL